jgi:hypothetical protein
MSAVVIEVIEIGSESDTTTSLMKTRREVGEGEPPKVG